MDFIDTYAGFLTSTGTWWLGFTFDVLFILKLFFDYGVFLRSFLWTCFCVLFEWWSIVIDFLVSFWSFVEDESLVFLNNGGFKGGVRFGICIDFLWVYKSIDFFIFVFILVFYPSFCFDSYWFIMFLNVEYFLFCNLFSLSGFFSIGIINSFDFLNYSTF